MLTVNETNLFCCVLLWLDFSWVIGLCILTLHKLVFVDYNIIEKHEFLWLEAVLHLNLGITVLVGWRNS